MTSAALLLALLAGPTPEAEPPVPSPSLLGSGLLTLQDTRTLPRGHFTAATTLHNRDRDPLGIDVFDYSLSIAVGIKPRMEAYGNVVFSRVVVVPDFSQTWPALPPPPLDLVMPQAMAVPERPYYAIVPPFPYANGRGDQKFSDFVPGDLVLGLKARLRDGDEKRTGFAVSGEIKIPLTRRIGALQSGSGTGGVDLSARGIAERRFAGMDIVTSATLTYVGGAPLDDRLLIANPEGSAIVEEPLRLASRIDLGVGLRRALSPRVALVGEMVATIEIYGAKTLDRISPLDLLAGVQARAGRVRLTTGILYAGGSPPSGVTRLSPLAGYVDLTRVSESDARQYLQQGGVGGAAAHLREGVQIVTPRVPGAALPTGARVIPDRYTIVSEHQIGYVVVLGWAF
jgi:hypothetical protein